MLSEDELYDWMAMYMLDPWGEERNDMANAITAAMIANVNRDPRKGKAVSPADLMAKWGMAAEAPEQTPEQVKQQLLASFGHRIKREGGAGMKTTLTFSGGKELEASLRSLGSEVAGRLGENAVRAGVRVLAAKMRKTTAFHDVTGATRKSFRVFSQIDRAAGSRTAYAGSDYFVARMLEFGTVKMPARPTVRPAVDAGGQAAVDALADNLAGGIEREASRGGR